MYHLSSDLQYSNAKVDYRGAAAPKKALNPAAINPVSCEGDQDRREVVEPTPPPTRIRVKRPQ